MLVEQVVARRVELGERVARRLLRHCVLRDRHVEVDELVLIDRARAVGVGLVELGLEVRGLRAPVGAGHLPELEQYREQVGLRQLARAARRAQPPVRSNARAAASRACSTIGSCSSARARAPPRAPDLGGAERRGSSSVAGTCAGADAFMPSRRARSARPRATSAARRAPMDEEERLGNVAQRPAALGVALVDGDADSLGERRELDSRLLRQPPRAAPPGSGCPRPAPPGGEREDEPLVRWQAQGSHGDGERVLEPATRRPCTAARLGATCRCATGGRACVPASASPPSAVRARGRSGCASEAAAALCAVAAGAFAAVCRCRIECSRRRGGRLCHLDV